MNDFLKSAALKYHSLNKPGKLSVSFSKPLNNHQDFSLAYTPGVAYPCVEIASNPKTAYIYTNKKNMVAVISNGTAVLGLGNIGALASKPVMEGKAMLFKYIAGIDAIDLEINETDPLLLAECINKIAITFGGINLEDVSSPSCFQVMQYLAQNCNIPTFHDDQNGTAIVITAALMNALKLANKTIEKVRIVMSGAGAAALATAEFLIASGAQIENIYIFDSVGLINVNRILPNHKMKFAKNKDATIQEILNDADVFIGLSVGNILKTEDILLMNNTPIIFALANPTPEINLEIAAFARPDAILASGKVNEKHAQVNNVLCFPYIFRAACDTQSKITNAMQMACVQALIAATPAGKIIPDALDDTLIYKIAPFIAQTAVSQKTAQLQLHENYLQYLDTMIHGAHITHTRIPKAGDKEAIKLCEILTIQGFTEKTEKTLFSLSLTEILAKIKNQQAKIIFETHEINNIDEIEKTIERGGIFLGAITETQILFNNKNRIWHAWKLCGMA